MPTTSVTINCEGRPRPGTPVSFYRAVNGNPFGELLESGATNWNGTYAPSTITVEGETYTYDIAVGPSQQYPFRALEQRYNIYGSYILANWREQDYTRRLYIMFTADAQPHRLVVGLSPCQPDRPRRQQQHAPQQIIIQPQEQQQPLPDYTPYIIGGVAVVSAAIIGAAAVMYSSKKQ